MATVDASATPGHQSQMDTPSFSGGSSSAAALAGRAFYCGLRWPSHPLVLSAHPDSG